MTDEPDIKAGIKKLEEQFGSRLHWIFDRLENVALTDQPCDITLFDGKPHIGVKVENSPFMALMYGAGAKKLAEMLSHIKLSNGATVHVKNIRTINPMPKDGFTEDELARVDLAEAEKPVGPNGETLRKMISDTYHCNSKEDEDRFLRRFIA